MSLGIISNFSCHLLPPCTVLLFEALAFTIWGLKTHGVHFGMLWADRGVGLYAPFWLTNKRGEVLFSHYFYIVHIMGKILIPWKAIKVHVMSVILGKYISDFSTLMLILTCPRANILTSFHPLGWLPFLYPSIVFRPSIWRRRTTVATQRNICFYFLVEITNCTFTFDTICVPNPLISERLIFAWTCGVP